MKALSLTQPWAALVAIGAKSIETRIWHTSYRGLVAIHAAKKFPVDARVASSMPPFSTALGVETLHTGALLAVARLTECFRFDARTEQLIRARSQKQLLPPLEAYFGDYTAGRYGFVLRDVQRLKQPIACNGALGLWDVPGAIAATIREETGVLA